MSVGLTGQKKGETRARVGRGGVYWQTGSAGKRRASRDVPTIDAFPRKMTPAEYEEAKNLWDDVEPFIHGTHRGDQIELDENVVRKVLRMQELTGYELIDAKAARTALRET